MIRCRRLGRGLAAVSPSADEDVAVMPDEATEVLLPESHSSGGTKLTVRRATPDDAVSLALVTSYAFAGSRSLQSIVDDPSGPPRPVGEARHLLH